MNNLSNDQMAKILSMNIASQLVSEFGLNMTPEQLVKFKGMYLASIKDDDLVDNLIKTFDDNAAKLQVMYN